MLKAKFGDVLLAELDRGACEDGLLDIRHGDCPSGRELSGTYMSALYSIMKQVLKSAMWDGEMAENPLDRVRPPKQSKPGRQSLTREQLARFLAALDSLPPDSHTVGVRIAVLAGLRRGEIVGLQWRDLDGTTLMVRRSMGECDRLYKEPKTAAGSRDVPIPPQLRDCLYRWKSAQADRLAAIGVEQTDETPILTSSTGGYVHPQNFDRWWRRNRATFGLDGVVLHELRHTYLTMLASSGAPFQVLKSLAGWSDAAMANRYVHEDSEANEAAVEALAEMISRNPGDAI